jgi:hypothetical protein
LKGARAVLDEPLEMRAAVRVEPAVEVPHLAQALHRQAAAGQLRKQIEFPARPRSSRAERSACFSVLPALVT